MLNRFPLPLWTWFSTKDLVLIVAIIFLIGLFFVGMLVDSSLLPELNHVVETNDGRVITLRTFGYR